MVNGCKSKERRRSDADASYIPAHGLQVWWNEIRVPSLSKITHLTGLCSGLAPAPPRRLLKQRGEETRSKAPPANRQETSGISDEKSIRCPWAPNNLPIALLLLQLANAVKERETALLSQICVKNV